jgi:hypothetical protein
MRVEQPRTVESTVTVKIDDYLAYWGKTTCENLTAAITRVVETNPTEAECERAFRVIKYAFPRLRSRSNEDLVEATLLGASAVGFLRNYEFVGDEPKSCQLIVQVLNHSKNFHSKIIHLPFIIRAVKT